MISGSLLSFYGNDGFANKCNEAACYLAYVYHGISHQSYLNVTKRRSMLRWFTNKNPRVVNPIPVDFLTFTGQDIDMYTLESEEPSYFGGVISGSDTGEITLPCIDFDNYDTMLNEFLTASFLMALKGDLRMARAYVQSAFLLMKIYSYKLHTDKVESNHLTTHRVTPFRL